MRDQQAGDLGVSLRNGPHQRGLPPFVLGRVDVRSMRDKTLDRVEIARPSCGHQHGFAHL